MSKFTEMLEMVSRTFALSIRYLPAMLREPVGLAYLLFRVSDCLEDHDGMAAERKVILLEQWPVRPKAKYSTIKLYPPG